MLRPSFPPGRPVLAALLDLNARIQRDFTFRSGVTTTSTPIARGAAASRRRVPGLHPPDDQRAAELRPACALRVRLHPHASVARASHGAWARISRTPGSAPGWGRSTAGLDLDPTNGIVVQDEHVVLGWGRDYGDVTPLRGVILGGGEQTSRLRSSSRKPRRSTSAGPGRQLICCGNHAGRVTTGVRAHT